MKISYQGLYMEVLIRENNRSHQYKELEYHVLTRKKNVSSLVLPIYTKNFPFV